MYSPVSRVRVFFPHGAPRRPPAGRERIGAVKGVRRSGGPDFLIRSTLTGPCARAAATGVGAVQRGLTRAEVTGHRCAAPAGATCVSNRQRSRFGRMRRLDAGAGGAPPDLSRTSRDVGRPDRSSHTLRLPLMAPRAVGSGTPLLPPLSYTRPTSGQRHKSRCVRASRRSHSFQRPSGSGSAHTLLALTHPCDCDSSFPVSPS